MKSLTVLVDEDTKKLAQQKSKKDGVTITFIVNQALKSYNNGTLQFGLIPSDNEITASFDVSSPKGKKACLDDFASL